MAGFTGSSADLHHWWQRHPWIGLYCGWLAIAALALGVSRCWMPEVSGSGPSPLAGEGVGEADG